MYFCVVMYCLFCDVSCIVCVYMCTEQLPAVGYPIAVKYIIYLREQAIDYKIRGIHKEYRERYKTSKHIEQKNTQNNTKIHRATQQLGRVRAVPRPCGFYIQ
jgi:hypothetical protein